MVDHSILRLQIHAEEMHSEARVGATQRMCFRRLGYGALQTKFAASSVFPVPL